MLLTKEGLGKKFRKTEEDLENLRMRFQKKTFEFEEILNSALSQNKQILKKKNQEIKRLKAKFKDHGNPKKFNFVKGSKTSNMSISDAKSSTTAKSISKPSFFELLKDGLFFRNPYRDNEKDGQRGKSANLMSQRHNEDLQKSKGSSNSHSNSGANFKLSKFKEKLSKIKLRTSQTMNIPPSGYPKKAEMKVINPPNFETQEQKRNKILSKRTIERPKFSNVLTEKSFSKYLDKDASGTI